MILIFQSGEHISTGFDKDTWYKQRESALSSAPITMVTAIGSEAQTIIVKATVAIV